MKKSTKILKILRGTWRDLKFDFEANRSRLLQPESFFVYRALERECLSPNYFFYTWPEKHLIYIEVPKCASSNILRTLAKGRHGLDFSADNPHDHYHIKLPGPTQLGISRFIELATDPETTIFSIVRNPYDRAMSCYLDKFANVKIGDGSYISNVVSHWWRFKKRLPPVDRPINFEEFCTLAQETASIGFDGHWALQSQIIPSNTLSPHIIGKFENLQDDLLKILKKIGASDEILEFLINSTKTPKVAGSQNTLDSKLRKMISGTYLEDFKRFGYEV